MLTSKTTQKLKIQNWDQNCTFVGSDCFSEEVITFSAMILTKQSYKLQNKSLRIE